MTEEPKIKQPVWKRHKVLEMFCPNCQTFMHGDGSGYHPYHCKCGTWHRDFETFNYSLTK